MNHTLENEKLTIFLEGELNSYNCDEVETEIEKIVSEKPFKSLVLDFDNLRYISSAGLRIIVRLKQRFDDLSLVKVSSDVYDILDMVGFVKMFAIEKK